MTEEERFWIRVDKNGPGGCWLWTGAIKPGGYGSFSPAMHRTYNAHRYAYQVTVGPIPEGLTLDHLCKVRHCVRPDHLEPVTHAENMRRGSQAQQTHCKHGHPFSGSNLAIAKDGTRRCKACNAARAKALRRRRGIMPRRRGGQR